MMSGMWVEWSLNLEKGTRHRKMQILELESTCVHWNGTAKGIWLGQQNVNQVLKMALMTRRNRKSEKLLVMSFGHQVKGQGMAAHVLSTNKQHMLLCFIYVFWILCIFLTVLLSLHNILIMRSTVSLYPPQYAQYMFIERKNRVVNVYMVSILKCRARKIVDLQRLNRKVQIYFLWCKGT